MRLWKESLIPIQRGKDPKYGYGHGEGVHQIKLTNRRMFGYALNVNWFYYRRFPTHLLQEIVVEGYSN